MGGRFPLDCETAYRFADINWTQLNARHKANYAAAVEEVFAECIQPSESESVRQKVRQVCEAISKLELTIKRGKHRPPSSKTKNKE